MLEQTLEIKHPQDMPESCIPETDSEGDFVLFVCTGNTCRSPMAAALFDAMAENGPVTFIQNGEQLTFEHIRALSAGLSVFPDDPISDEALMALKKEKVPEVPGYAYSEHKARVVDEKLIRGARLVIGITRRHAAALLRSCPAAAEKIYALPEDIPDPYGGTLEDYLSCLSSLKRAIGVMFHGSGQGDRK